MDISMSLVILFFCLETVVWGKFSSLFMKQQSDLINHLLFSGSTFIRRIKFPLDVFYMNVKTSLWCSVFIHVSCLPTQQLTFKTTYLCSFFAFNSSQHIIIQPEIHFVESLIYKNKYLIRKKTKRIGFMGNVLFTFQ